MVKQLLHVSSHLRPNCGNLSHKYIVLDQILKAPAVLTKIEQLFPHEDFESIEHNALMTTIRIPKNLMYLSDKLPRPSYDPITKDEPNNLRNTTDAEGYSLPSIPAQKRPKQKPQKNL